MKKQQGSLLGAVLLIGASCLGAGMLGLPIQTGLVGFFPSLGMFLFIAFYMMLSGLLFTEATSWYPIGANIQTMAKSTLGKPGKIVATLFYLFLFYALLVAFISASGNLFSSILFNFFGWKIPTFTGSLLFVAIFGYLVYLGTRPVDLCNRFLMFIKIGAFLVLVLLGIWYIQPHYYEYVNPSLIHTSLPILITAFGFQNIVPILNTYFNGDTKKVKEAVILGTLFALVIYLLWQTVVLGIIPLSGPVSLESSFHSGVEATQAMSEIMQSSWISPLSQLFGFFAVLTSFLAQSLSLSHFLSQSFSITYKKHENALMCALALIPPLSFALLFPTIFFKALSFAGGFCIAMLFGILPSLMIWKGRYRQKHPMNFQVFGGKTLLILFFSLSVYLFGYEIVSLIF